ncbi:MAG TPA: hypothetical protein PLW02_12730, partial [Verrucomicrobiota bacterium]|nr:hypothetical protein [Verrucomicrobiota bacterium]
YLEAGKMYAVEALMQEGGVDDYLVVRWALPSNPSSFVTISGTNLFAGIDPAIIKLQITQQPQDITVAAGRRAIFKVETYQNPSDIALTYQWQVSVNETDWQDIENATGKSYTTPNLTLGDSGKWFRCVVTMTGITQTISDAAKLTVIPDEVPPIVISMNAFSNFIGIEFDERVDAETATNIANYVVNGGTVQVTGIELRPSETQVKLSLGQYIFGQYTVDISGVKDIVGNQMEPVQKFGIVSDLMFVDIGNPQPPGYLFTSREGDYDVKAGGADVWDGVNQFSYIFKPITGDFDVKVRVQRLDYQDIWSKAGIMARESLNDQAGMFWVNTTPTNGANVYQGSVRQSTGSGISEFSTIRPPVTYPNSWMRVKREGQIFTAYTSTNGYNWNLLGTPQEMPSMPQTMFVGLATVSHLQGTATYAEFRDYSPTVYPEATVTIIQQPVSQSVANGATATFVVNAQVENVPA